MWICFIFFFQAEDGIRDADVTGVQTCALPISKMEQAGYLPVATFILPEECWTDHFYAPQVAVQEMYLQQHAGNPPAEMLIREQRRERALYDKYKEFYGYVFYIGKKI